MKKLSFIIYLILIAYQSGFSQIAAQSLSVIATPNSKAGWIYFKDPNTINPNNIFTLYATNFGLGADDQMQFIKNETDELGVTHTYYNQYYKNVKIEVGQNTVHSRNGKAHLLTGKICIGLSMNVIPTISSVNAISYAKNYVNANIYKWQDSLEENNLKLLSNNINATYYPLPELLITRINDNLPLIPSNLKLAYRIELHCKMPFDAKVVYVDANSGNILKEGSLRHGAIPVTVNPNTCVSTLGVTLYNGPQVIPAFFTANASNGGALEYKLMNPCKGGGIITKNNLLNTYQDVYSPTITWGSSNTTLQLNQIHWSTSNFYDFLLNNFNRQSIDNNNMPLISVLTSNGPEFDPIINAIDIPLNYGASDMVGHEWGHGITKYCLANGLPTTGESVCISEGMSDVWGTLFEFYLKGNNANWLVGEDYVSNPYIRSLSNPLSKNQADTYKGTNYDINNINTYANGGVLGYWFYLMSHGGSGVNSFYDSNDPNNLNGHNYLNYNIQGIGMSQVSQIFYRAYPYLTSSLSYYDLRNATIQAASDLFGTSCVQINMVKNAWDAVGVYDMLPEIGNPSNIVSNSCVPACLTKTNLSCVNTLGSANITVDPSFTNPYNVSWNTSDFSTSVGGNSTSVNNLLAGDYVVILQDNTNTDCVSFYYFTIDDFSTTTLSFNSTNAICTDGSASVFANGGTYPYTYSWSISNINLPDKTTPFINNLPAGTYNVTVTDANGCQTNGSVVVGQTAVTFYKPYNYHVTGTETWNQSIIKVDGIIYVDNGATLNITGNTRVEVSHHVDILDMMPYGVARIVVLPGGTLNVAPTVTLTGCGGGTWDGIELWGTGVFDNGAAIGNINGQIENADIGVLTDARPKLNQSVINKYGGMLTSNGARFINNKISISMPRKKTAQGFVSQIKQSTFTTDGTSFYKNDFNSNFNGEPIHIYAGLNVRLNASSNTMTGGDQYYTADLKGTGIKCIDCILNVDNTSGPISNFTGLTRAIDKENVFSTNRMVVDAANFNDNQEAIYMQGSAYDEVTNSTFAVPIPVAPFTKSYALFAVNSNGFDISGNTINPSAANASSYGMVFDDSKTMGGVVFNNTFNGVGVGLQAQNDNSNLKIGCNNFNNPISHSMRVVNIIGTAALKQQGLNCGGNGNPAGNEWIYGCPSGNSTTNVFVDSQVNFLYYSYNANALNQPYTEPLCSSSAWKITNVLPYVCGFNKTLSSCGSVFPLPPPPPSSSYSTYYAAIKNLINTYQTNINTLIPQYKNALASQDGGNTKNLLDAINLNPKKSPGQLKNLLTSSGALSDAVLLAVINRNPALPAGTLKEILAKQIPLSLAIITAIQNSNLPAGIKNEIYAAQSNTPIYVKASSLEAQIKYYKGDIILLESELQRTKLRESRTLSKQDLKQSTDPTSKMILVQNYATVNQTDSVRLVLNQLATDTTIVLTEKQNFISYMNTIADMLDSNKTVYTVDSLILSSITPVSTSNSKISAQANVILKERKKPHHHYFIADIPTNNNARLIDNNEEEDNDKTLLSNNGTFKIFPNPNTGNFKIVFYESKQSDEQITVSISNLLGQIIYTKTLNSDTQSEVIISDENIVKGVYIITLTQSNNNIGQSKLIVE